MIVKALQVPLSVDLAPLTKILWQLQIRHRVVFESQQVVLVDGEREAAFVIDLYQHWLASGEFPQALISEFKSAASLKPASKKIDYKSIPCVLVLLLLSVAISLYLDFGEARELLRYFTITDFKISAGALHYTSLEQNFASYELWRFISPVFIHFNLAHLVFNGLWICLVGSAIEREQGSFVLVFISAIAGVGSNIAQYYVSGPVFGGLSGIVYAVISYAWLWDKLADKQTSLTGPPTVRLKVVSDALMSFMILWLVLGYSDVLSSLGFGEIANTAHLAGLISAAVTVPAVLFFKQKFNK